MITWQDRGSVYVANVPSQNNGGNCTLNPVKVGNGKEPAFGQATLQPTGPTGPTGPTNPTGPTGPTNPTGPTGPTNPTGPTGPTNPTGPTGPTNPTGPTGPTGPSGPAKPRVALKVNPAMAKVKAGRKTKLTVAVSASGATAAKVKVCAKVTGKARKAIKPAGCKTLMGISAGKTVKAALAIRTTRQARGSYAIRVSASGPGIKTVNSNHKVKVTR
jgi:hypothetical protein